jgi:Flp pilus assembly protein TadB
MRWFVKWLGIVFSVIVCCVIGVMIWLEGGWNGLIVVVGTMGAVLFVQLAYERLREDARSIKREIKNVQSDLSSISRRVIELQNQLAERH